MQLRDPKSVIANAQLNASEKVLHDWLCAQEISYEKMPNGNAMRYALAVPPGKEEAVAALLNKLMGKGGISGEVPVKIDNVFYVTPDYAEQAGFAIPERASSMRR